MIVIERTTPVARIHALFPESREIFEAYGLHCFGCSMEGRESLEEGCRLHKFEEELIDELIDDLLTAAKSLSPRPQEIEITDAACEVVGKTLEKSSFETARDVILRDQSEAEVVSKGAERAPQDDSLFLRVTLDDNYQFCLEVIREAPEGEKLFENTSTTPPTQVCASEEILFRIGGGKIDFRDGRLKIDLPEVKGETGEKCCNS